MRATHTNYQHPGHLRVEDRADILCVSPFTQSYAGLNRPSLPNYDDAAHLVDFQRLHPECQWQIAARP